MHACGAQRPVSAGWGTRRRASRAACARRTGCPWRWPDQAAAAASAPPDCWPRPEAASRARLSAGWGTRRPANRAACRAPAWLPMAVARSGSDMSRQPRQAAGGRHERPEVGLGDPRQAPQHVDRRSWFMTALHAAAAARLRIVRHACTPDTPKLAPSGHTRALAFLHWSLPGRRGQGVPPGREHADQPCTSRT